MKEIDVDGVKIPIFTVGELIQPVLRRYNVWALDAGIEGLGRPPRTLLRLLCVDMALTNGKQVAGGTRGRASSGVRTKR